MASFTRTLQVPYSPGSMFALVDRVEDYPQFLPWCSEASVERYANNEILATLVLRRGGLQHRFSTTNHHDREALCINVRLARGPLSFLRGRWSFHDNRSGGCEVRFVIDYAFANRLLDRLLGPLFATVYERMVDAFAKRADDVYGATAQCAASAQFEVEVVYATPTYQFVRRVMVPQGANIRTAVEISGLLQEVPEINLDTQPVGIFSRRLQPDTVVSAGDRIEVYRQLAADPNERRRQSVR